MVSFYSVKYLHSYIATFSNTPENPVHWEGEGVLKVCLLHILMLLHVVVKIDGFAYPEADTVMYEFGLSLPIQYIESRQNF